MITWRELRDEAEAFGTSRARLVELYRRLALPGDPAVLSDAQLRDRIIHECNSHPLDENVVWPTLPAEPARVVEPAPETREQRTGWRSWIPTVLTVGAVILVMSCISAVVIFAVNRGVFDRPDPTEKAITSTELWIENEDDWNLPFVEGKPVVLELGYVKDAADVAIEGVLGLKSFKCEGVVKCAPPVEFSFEPFTTGPGVYTGYARLYKAGELVNEIPLAVLVTAKATEAPRDQPTDAPVFPTQAPVPTQGPVLPTPESTPNIPTGFYNGPWPEGFVNPGENPGRHELGRGNWEQLERTFRLPDGSEYTGIRQVTANGQVVGIDIGTGPWGLSCDSILAQLLLPEWAEVVGRCTWEGPYGMHDGWTTIELRKGGTCESPNGLVPCDGLTTTWKLPEGRVDYWGGFPRPVDPNGVCQVKENRDGDSNLVSWTVICPANSGATIISDGITWYPGVQ